MVVEKKEKPVRTLEERLDMVETMVNELRPLSSVIRHLIDDPRIGAEVTHYLQDVDDKLSNVPFASRAKLIHASSGNHLIDTLQVYS